MRIIQGLCCWGTDYCKCQFLHLSRNQNIKLSYILLILLILASTSFLPKLNPQQSNTSSEWMKEQLTFCWFFPLAIMHFILIFLVMLRSQLSKIMNQGAWLIKILFCVGLGVLFVFGVSSSGLGVVRAVGGYLVPIWYLLQSLIVIDMIYTIDNSLRQLAQSNNKFHLLKALLGLMSVIGAVVLNVLSYTHHKQSSSTFYITIISSIQIGIFLIICLLRVSKSNTLFVYGLITLYSNLISFYIHCPAPQYPQSSFNTIQLILIILSLLCILSPGSNKIRTRKSSLNQILALNTSKEEEDNRYVSSNKWIIFHLVFFFICFTLPWVVNQGGQSFREDDERGNVWGQIFKMERIVGWFMITIVYVWTLVAAKLYPQQDFDQLENYFKQFQLN